MIIRQCGWWSCGLSRNHAGKTPSSVKGESDCIQSLGSRVKFGPAVGVNGVNYRLHQCPAVKQCMAEHRWKKGLKAAKEALPLCQDWQIVSSSPGNKCNVHITTAPRVTIA
ncbi:uncharacterized protein LOC121593959 [Anopheles merus]|uniref:uncharacterized protein LOC121593959 n=1 Tax=Anopheles merus TaxID=30066 RepID=UPI001BE494B2|nr:uncharacterized protein LOC121593959 [Anopheles merus]